jgi:hypothetical protein
MFATAGRESSHFREASSPTARQHICQSLFRCRRLGRPETGFQGVIEFSACSEAGREPIGASKRVRYAAFSSLEHPTHSIPGLRPTASSIGKAKSPATPNTLDNSNVLKSRQDVLDYGWRRRVLSLAMCLYPILLLLLGLIHVT